MANWLNLTLEEARALPEPRAGKAIYFLWKDDELLYIGASTQVSERVARQAQFRDFGHLGSDSTRAKPRIPFNRATALKWEGFVEDMAEAEKALIRRWWPPWNDRCDDGDQVWARHIAQERRDSK